MSRLWKGDIRGPCVVQTCKGDVNVLNYVSDDHVWFIEQHWVHAWSWVKAEFKQTVLIHLKPPNMRLSSWHGTFPSPSIVPIFNKDQTDASICIMLQSAPSWGFYRTLTSTPECLESQPFGMAADILADDEILQCWRAFISISVRYLRDCIPSSFKPSMSHIQCRNVIACIACMAVLPCCMSTFDCQACVAILVILFVYICGTKSFKFITMSMPHMYKAIRYTTFM